MNRDELTGKATSIVIQDFDCRDGREDEIAEIMTDFALEHGNALLKELRQKVEAIVNPYRPNGGWHDGYAHSKSDVLEIIDGLLEDKANDNERER